ncbi:MAG: methylglyoxal synthase [Actinobacteria bacterium]|nr:methylglyoxal synthase [Actinomycetota bacterium]
MRNLNSRGFIDSRELWVAEQRVCLRPNTTCYDNAGERVDTEVDLEHKTVTTPKNKKRKNRATVALIAHDAKKVDIVMFANEHRDSLQKCELIATRATGEQVTQNTGLDVKCLLGGPDGGDLQIGGLIASGEVDLVIFLRDPLQKQPHDPDITALLRVCDVHNIPLATNPTSAHLLLRGIAQRLDANKPAV